MALFLIIASMETGLIWCVMIGFGILGFITVPGIPAAFELVCELVFPIGEGSAIGYLMAFTSLIAFVSGIGFS